MYKECISNQQLPRLFASVLCFQLMSITTKRSGCGNLAPGLCPKSYSQRRGLHRWGSPTARRPVVSDYYCAEFIPRVVNYTVQKLCVRSGARIE